MIAEREPAATADQAAAIDAAIEAISPPADIEPWFRSYASNHKDRLSRDLAIIDQIATSGSRILELGALPLVLTRALAERFPGMQAVDVAPERFGGAIGEIGCPVLKCDIERDELPVPSRSVNLALFNEVFEHLRIDLLFTLSELHRVLVPGGRLMLSTPNLRSVRGIRKLVFEGRSAWCCPDVHSEWSKLRTLGHMGHVREYTFRDVSDLLDKMGFLVERVFYRGTTASRIERLVCRFRPEFLPYMCIVAVRKDAGAA